MISYAQNFEDVMLARALPAAHGFYVDVGANDPVIDSVTYHFYRRGWRGICIEPQPALHARHLALRAGDIALAVLAGADAGEAAFYEYDALHGLSTRDADVVAEHARRNWHAREVVRRITTLDAVLAEHGAGRAIDFLSIDVEGAELDVLRGLDLRRHRPKIIVAEAMAPTVQVDVSAPVVAHLACWDYACVYEDGLNRFYLAAEHAALAAAFRYPPNVFDRFSRYVAGPAPYGVSTATDEVRPSAE